MRSSRAELVAETALTLLAERGMRGLTHRAVDEAAGLPPGSASNVARTRTALLELAMERLNELEERQFAAVAAAGGTAPVPAAAGTGAAPTNGTVRGAEAPADLIARLLHALLTVDRRRTLARYELALEATRRPELRKIYDESGRRFREPAVALMARAGSPEPLRHGRQLVMFAEGIMFDVIAGAGDETTLDGLRLAVADFLSGMLGGTAAGPPGPAHGAAAHGVQPDTGRAGNAADRTRAG